jgi:hypothetical protein
VSAFALGFAFLVGVAVGWYFGSTAAGAAHQLDPVAVGQWFGFDWHEFLRMVTEARQAG